MENSCQNQPRIRLSGGNSMDEDDQFLSFVASSADHDRAVQTIIKVTLDFLRPPRSCRELCPDSQAEQRETTAIT